MRGAVHEPARRRRVLRRPVPRLRAAPGEGRRAHLLLLEPRAPRRGAGDAGGERVPGAHEGGDADVGVVECGSRSPAATRSPSAWLEARCGPRPLYIWIKPYDLREALAPASARATGRWRRRRRRPTAAAKNFVRSPSSWRRPRQESAALRCTLSSLELHLRLVRGRWRPRRSPLRRRRGRSDPTTRADRSRRPSSSRR